MSTGGLRASRRLAKASDNNDEAESVDKLSGITDPEEDDQPSESEQESSGEQGQPVGSSMCGPPSSTVGDIFLPVP